MTTNRLQDERCAIAMPMEGMQRVFHGDKAAQARRQRALELLTNDPLLGDASLEHYGLSIAEQRERAKAQLARYYEIQNDPDSKDIADDVLKIAASIEASWSVRLGVSRALFGETLRTQGSQELIDRIYPSILDGSTIGCFCMTELGTGSYIQNFETRASYEADTQEFVLESPSLSSTKWWIGAAATSATWAVVFARLILKDEDYGTHVFLVRLRDEQMQVYPEIEIGDVGPKRGWNGVDNGYVRFHKLRIPRTQMLGRWSRVEEDGSYTSSPIPQLAYAALLAGRVSVIQSAVATSKAALALATRFCIVREQHSLLGQSIMDYQVQHERLLSRLAAHYAYHFATKHLERRHDIAMRELDQGELASLKSVHGFAAGLKGSIVLWAAETLHDCTLAMGGHAYSAYSSLPDRIADWAVLIPGEGDAVVMQQQAARQLIQTLVASVGGSKPEDPEFHYLTETTKKCEVSSPELSCEELDAALHWLAVTVASDAADELHLASRQLGSPKEGWNASQLVLVQAAECHIAYRSAQLFKEALEGELVETLGADADQWLPLLSKLRECFILNTLIEQLSVLLEHGYLKGSEAKLLRRQLLACYRDLRPYTVHLVDAWGLSDLEIASPLGRYDGELYEAYFTAVKNWSKRCS